MITHNIETAAAFLNVSADTMKDLAGSGVVPGAKIGKAWVFTDEALEEYLRSEIARQTAERRGSAPDQGRAAKVPTAFARTVRRKPMAPPSLHSSAQQGIA